MALHFESALYDIMGWRSYQSMGTIEVIAEDVDEESHNFLGM